MIRIPSFTTLLKSIRSIVFRFPLLFLISIWSIGVWWFAIDATPYTQNKLYLVLGLSNFAFCSVLAITLYAQQHKFAPLRRWLLKSAAILSAFLLYLYLSPIWEKTNIYQLLLLVTFGHLLVSFLPFASKTRSKQFWQYNLHFFLRILTAFLYSLLLYAGLALALYAIESLFSISFDGDVHIRLFALISVGFSSWFFLAGIPSDLSFPDEDNYPVSIKIFSQYVLIPLVLVYLSILLLYEGKILFEQTLPSGLVSILIIGYTGLGILSFLLTYPLRYKSDRPRILLFHNGFFFLTIPLLILFVIAIRTRVVAYGVTEPRYLLIVLALWLCMLTLYYFIARKRFDLRFIPVTLCGLCIISLFGPQSASNIALNSQINRFKKMDTVAMSNKERANIVRYLVQQHGFVSLQPLTTRDLEEVRNEAVKDTSMRSTYLLQRTLTDSAFSILKIDPTSGIIAAGSLQFEPKDPVVNISGYDYLLEVSAYTDLENDSTSTRPWFKAKTSQNGRFITITIDQRDSIQFDLTKMGNVLQHQFEQGLLKRGENGGTIITPTQSLRIDTASSDYDIALAFRRFNLSNVNQADSLQGFSYLANLLIHRKNPGN